MWRNMLFFLLNCALYLVFWRQVKLFRTIVGYFPNIALPRKYHEKMLWRKIFDHNPLFPVFCDKLATKEYTRMALPGISVPKTLWSGPDLSAAPRELFNAKVAVKANHGSGYNLFCGPGKRGAAEACAASRQWLAECYGRSNWEWGYFGVSRLLFAEEFIAASTPRGLVDIHVRCADGKAIFAHVYLHHKTEDVRVGFYSPAGAPLRFPCDALNCHGGLPEDFTLPDTFPQAIAHAETLSRGFDLIRIDFMANGATLHAGEITVYPGTGVTRATPDGVPGADSLSNPHWDLRKSWFLSTPQTGWRRLYARLLRQALDLGRPTPLGREGA